MSWLAVVSIAIQIAWFLVQRFFKMKDENKEQAEILLKEGKDAIRNKDASAITRFFDSVSRV